MTKTVMKAKRVPKRLNKNTLRFALVSGLKAKTGRKDIKFKEAPSLAAKTQHSVPIEQRAGFPLKIAKGSVHPKDWVSGGGDKIEVDFTRAKWLPDDWGQGVKMTHPGTLGNRKKCGGGGILTTFVAPDGKSFFHKESSERYAGVKEWTIADGWNGQVRMARLQADQALQLARVQIKALKSGGPQQLVTTDPDEAFFKILTPQERRNLPRKDEFHFCIVSARRATSLNGVRDIFMVQSQFEEAGVTPTWYVDEQSLKDYQKLGLKAVVGGKLTQARNKALRDARRLGKACVQASDDISAWEYREGKKASERSDDAMNRAYEAARRYIVSPVAAARFILAKMRSAEEPRPQLGGVYMLGSCSRTFGGEPFVRHNFIIGDFFVVDKSTVMFDENMKLKEDYDFTCSHIQKHGSVMRCQRMTLMVKHYSNSGGACSMRDKKGQEEQRNIAILNEKWPGCFRLNPKRKNEVIMRRWKGTNTEGDDEEEGDEAEGDSTQVNQKMRPQKTIAKRKSKPSLFGLKPDAVIVRTGKAIDSPYIAERCKKVAGKSIKHALCTATFSDSAGTKRAYRASDLKYDVHRGYLSLRKRK